MYRDRLQMAFLSYFLNSGSLAVPRVNKQDYTANLKHTNKEYIEHFDSHGLTVRDLTFTWDLDITLLSWHQFAILLL